ARGKDTLGVPDILLMRSEEVVVFDNLRGSLFLLVLVDPADADAAACAQTRLDVLETQLRAPLAEPAGQRYGEPVSERDFVSEFPEQAFKDGVEKIRNNFLAGDGMKVVASQSISVAFAALAV